MNPVILLPNRSNKGTLAYIANQGLPIFIHGKQVRQVVYTDINHVPELHDLVPSKFFDLDGRRAQRGQQAKNVRAMHAQEKSLGLILVPTTVCSMSCSYCYARQDDGKHSMINFDLNRLKSFLDVHGKKFRSVIVYGGDSLMQDGLAKLLRDGTSQSTSICYVTGLGYPLEVFQKKVQAALDQRVYFSLSIDAPAIPGEPYGRVYKLYPDDNGHQWYHELLKRASWINQEGKKRDMELCWGVRPTVTRTAYDHRQLRRDLCEATGLPDISINIEPAVSGYDTQSPKHQGVVDKIARLLQQDVDDILGKKLDLKMNQYFRDKIFDITNPFVHFSRGGCYSYFWRLTIGPRGELSFCNEVPTYEQAARDPWTFGNIDKIDTKGYAKVLGHVYRRPAPCHDCTHRFSCGTHCPIKLLKDDLDGCPFSRLHAEKTLQLMADADNAEQIWDQTLPIRLKNLKEWEQTPELSDSELEQHAQWMLS